MISYFGERYIKRAEIDADNKVKLQVGSKGWSWRKVNLKRIRMISKDRSRGG